MNGWCFRGIYKGGLWEDDLHVSDLKRVSQRSFKRSLLIGQRTTQATVANQIQDFRE